MNINKQKCTGSGRGVLDGSGARHLQRQNNGALCVEVLARLRAALQLQADVEARTHPCRVLAMPARDRHVQAGSVEMLGVSTQRGGELGADAARGDRARLGLPRFGGGELHDEAARAFFQRAEEGFGEQVTCSYTKSFRKLVSANSFSINYKSTTEI